MVISRIREPEVMDSRQEAVDYDSMDHGAVNQLFVDEFVAFAESQRSPGGASDGSILDIGTGTAQIPVRLAESWPVDMTVIAVDLSFEMLKVAQQNIRQADVTNSILPVLCDAKRLPFGDNSVGVVMSNSIVHHIPEPIDVFKELARVLCDGGIVFIRDLLRPDSVDELDHLVATYAGQENEHQRAMFRDSLYAALTLDEVRELLTAVGFEPGWASVTRDRHWTVAGVV
jgi:ubiquinone/menaquinone biosynthesis C-methylase UbiE